ncbi:MAG: hypothetical protein Q7N95_05055, partial [Alphaproteobacteria bacterium]|nr:hypothetical protein [Alphaproteobacteria bacterium]
RPGKDSALVTRITNRADPDQADYQASSIYVEEDKHASGLDAFRRRLSITLTLYDVIASRAAARSQ